MTGKVVLEHSHSQEANHNILSNSTESLSPFQVERLSYYTPIQVATTVTFLVAIFQVRIKKLITKTNKNLLLRINKYDFTSVESTV